MYEGVKITMYNNVSKKTLYFINVAYHIFHKNERRRKKIIKKLRIPKKGIQDLRNIEGTSKLVSISDIYRRIGEAAAKESVNC